LRSRSFTIIRNRSRTFAIIHAISLPPAPRGVCRHPVLSAHEPLNPNRNPTPNRRKFMGAMRVKNSGKSHFAMRFRRWSDGPPDLVSSFPWLSSVQLRTMVWNHYYPAQHECTAKRKTCRPPPTLLAQRRGHSAPSRLRGTGKREKKPQSTFHRRKSLI
jgi:hypothetical protein